MVIFEQTLRAILIATNLVEKRVFLMRAPQAPASQQQIPYFVFFPVGKSSFPTHAGPLDQTETVYQVSIFDTSQSRALAIADSLRAKLDTLHGSHNGWRIGHCLFEIQSWQWEEDVEIFHVIQEYRVMYSALETQPAAQSATPIERTA